MRVSSEDIASLYAIHAQPLLRLARLLVGPDAAEDLVQDAFVKALDHWRPDAPQEAFRAWARTVMARESISRWRRSTRERAAFERLAEDGSYSDSEAVPEVARALEALSPRVRTAMILAYFEDLSAEQIGKEMGVKASTARALLYQGREKLRMDPTLVQA
jgi:RNA polymerase sigma factor (sigma-70 family)